MSKPYTLARHLTLPVILALGSMAAPAMAQDPARVDQVVRLQSDAGTFTGAVLIGRDGQVVFDKGYGLANREWNIPNDGQTKYRLGSVTKQFTAAGIMLLVEQGKVDLDAPIKTYVEAAPAAWDHITVRHLLAHTSGIPNFTDFPDFMAQNTQPATLESLIARFKDRPLTFTPGETFAYSNSGYILLSAIIEKASGQTYEAFVTDRLFKPLGLKDTGYDRHATILPRRAAGYTPSPSGVVNADYGDMSIPAGAGALYSTTHDLMKWNEALYGGKLLKAESLALMTTPVLKDNGFGLFIRNEAGRQLIQHSGGIQGFNTYLAWDPETRSSIVVLGNMNGNGPDVVGDQLATLVQGGEVTLPNERTTVEISADELKEYEGAYPLAPTFIITVKVVDGKLSAQATGQPAFSLTAEAKDRFFLTVVDAQLSFTRDADGTVEGLILHQNGRDMPAKKSVN
jgi:CubicO group peptidase (beta-lactamase class C family)